MRSTSPGPSNNNNNNNNSGRKALNRREGGESTFTDRLSLELENYLSETAPTGSHYRRGSGGGGGGGAGGEYEEVGGRRERTASMSKINFDEDQDEDDARPRFCGFSAPKTFLGIKANTVVRMLKVCSAFPFVIVVAALNFSNKYAFLR